MKNMTIHALHEKLVQRELTAVALTEAYLKHKDTVEPQIRAFLSDTREEALQTAAAVDAKIKAGKPVSELAGIRRRLKIIFVFAGSRLRALPACWKILRLRIMRRLLKNWRPKII